MSTATNAAVKTRPTIVFIGNPNTGKSTIFNRLSGLQSRVGNFPGVTVEKKIGQVTWHNQALRLIDLPGTYSLSPRTLDEMISVDVLTGRQPDVGRVDGVVCVTDATNLERNLYLVSQLLDLEVPLVLVLNMTDTAEERKIRIDEKQLADRLGIPVIKTQGHRGIGLGELKQTLAELASSQSFVRVKRPRIFPDSFYQQCDRLKRLLAEMGHPESSDYVIERLLLDTGGYAESRLVRNDQLANQLAEMRQQLRDDGCPIPAIEARVRYQWARNLLDGIASRPDTITQHPSDRIDQMLTHRLIGPVVFCALMFLVFQSIYTWAGPAMDAIESVQGWATDQVIANMNAGPFRSLLTDGILAGVGSVLVFLPQIAILFFFIALLEDCGYMARAAFLMDRLMTRVGLSGKSFVPLMSSFACAIPGVMATRVIENRRDRMVTLLIAPLMSCSARLPVYLLLIGAFVPATSYLNGWIGLRGLVLFAMSSLGALIAIPVALLLKKFLFPGETPPFVMELPAYKWPSATIVLMRVYERCKAFIVRAGGLIFATTIVVWAAGSFPGDRSEVYQLQSQLESAPEGSAEYGVALQRYREESAKLLRGSVLGQLGRAVEPVVRPLGWDWRIGVGTIASFPAREVIIATLGTIYSLGGDVDEQDAGLIAAMKAAHWPNGDPVYNVPVALSIMVFFALCAQCGATLMVIRRETNSWRWPIFSFTYMTLLAYAGALITYQVAARIAGL